MDIPTAAMNSGSRAAHAPTETGACTSERPQVANGGASLIACCARFYENLAIEGRSDRRSRMAGRFEGSSRTGSRAAHAPTETGACASERPQVANGGASLIACCARFYENRRLRVGATAGREWRGIVDRVLRTLLRKSAPAGRSDRRSGMAGHRGSRAAHAPTKTSLARRSDRRSRMSGRC